MKYTTRVKQAQMIGDVRIDPKGGDLNTDQVKKIKEDPWGKELIRKGALTIEGVKPDDIKDDVKKKAASAAGGAKPETIPDFDKDGQKK
jgi:hypothetical protein